MSDLEQIARATARETVRSQFSDVCSPMLREMASTANTSAEKVSGICQSLTRVEVILNNVVDTQRQTAETLRRVLVGNGNKGLEVRLAGLEHDVGSLQAARKAIRSGFQSFVWGGAMRLLVAFLLFVTATATAAFVVRRGNDSVREEVIRAVKQSLPELIEQQNATKTGG